MPDLSLASVLGFLMLVQTGLVLASFVIGVILGVHIGEKWQGESVNQDPEQI